MPDAALEPIKLRPRPPNMPDAALEPIKLRPRPPNMPDAALEPIKLRPRPPNMTDEEWRQWVENELSDGATTFNLLSAEIKSNTDITNQIKKDTGEMLELFANLQAAFKVLNGIGKVLKPIGIILGACTAAAGFYAAFFHGAPPPK